MDLGSMDPLFGPGPWTPCHGPGPWIVFLFLQEGFAPGPWTLKNRNSAKKRFHETLSTNAHD